MSCRYRREKKEGEKERKEREGEGFVLSFANRNKSG